MTNAGKLAAVLGKEMLELTRSLKLLWVPLVFVLLGIAQPVMNYYMPFILENAGGLPEGTIIEIPTPTGGQVLAETLSQFGLMGLLILVLACMGTVSGERNSGAASLVLAKPISFGMYILAKWVAIMVLSWGSLLMGYVVCWYYTSLLFEGVDAALFFKSYLLYGLWFAFIMTLTLLFSTLLRNAAGSAFSALGIAVVLSLFAGLMPGYLFWLPGALSGYAYEVVGGGTIEAGQAGWAIAAAIAAIALAIWSAVGLLRRSPAID